MNQKRLVLASPLLEIVISRLSQELIENHTDFANSVVLGLQPRGIYFAERVVRELNRTLAGRYPAHNVPLGYLDATFYRDDFRRRDAPLRPNTTHVPFLIEDKRVILIDDVMATGRMVRAALDAMSAFGRPRKVELMVLIDRQFNRDLPIKPDYVGQRVQTLDTQRVLVEWTEQGAETDRVWLIDKA
ncbi:bifunctional pyr operon transcriptional regulator/uracil phosphoribosyltransferase PyrR [Fibrella sp. HMF5335]|uniref:Bifunctional pyr operon transcriptional regulator/uracil phosphoribosyltransferase PyrR n=1 Tax=Fibrella rubiginis TaxID=2817060 RepID=A0A939GD77_9BACT|nr:bifunctional pyr operon transcriptional regulator/uracil phosphoribosyltransferase PyrR [Fibrella rubiginis]MBO0936211.1 bifunctional pyr operon transcriptional regulator/uracil phosphoribosyltransferase PyrR [Fibrella rubiginis]